MRPFTPIAALIVWSGLLSPLAAEQPTRIAFPSGMNGQIVVTMDKAGIAEKNGLKAEFSAFQYGPPMMEALAAGSIDIVVTSMMPVASFASKLPGEIKVVAMVNTGGHSLLVDSGSDMTEQTLAGRKVGVSFASDSHLDLVAYLRKLGILDKVTLINIQPVELAVALGNKSVDAVVVRQPQALRLEKSGARTIKEWPLKYVSIARSKFIKDNPEKLEKYLLALRETILYMAQNPDKSAVWFAEYLRADPAIVKEVAKRDPMASASNLSQVDISIKPEDKAMIEDRLSEALEQKLIKTRVDAASLLR